MMRKSLRTFLLVLLATAAVPALASAPLELHSVPFPEREPVDLRFVASSGAPAARINAEVVYRRGQARVELSYESMKPAILYGGDVTCYVLWAVTRDGRAENLGELLTRKMSGKLSFSTGLKNFALMVTAEAYYLVGKPSELVVFRNAPVFDAGAASTAFKFTNLAAAPDHGMTGITHISWDAKILLELLQARKAFELATRMEGSRHAPVIYAEAKAAMDDANEIARSISKSKALLDASRRAVALSNEALNISAHRVEAIELERRITKRRQETEALEQRAAEAERKAEQAQLLATRVNEEAERVRAEKERMAAETEALRTEKIGLESAMLLLRQEKTQLQGESALLRQDKQQLERESQTLMLEKSGLQEQSQRLMQEKNALIQEKNALAQESERLQREKSALEQASDQLRREKAELAGRLQSALSLVADTQESARGLVVNLPDILFDVDEATLKPEARMLVAKLAGILLIMRDQDVLIEGHTDSTGSARYNLDLSERRAAAVGDLLRIQGLDPARLQAMGFGMERPVADNSTADGRKRNRRVEIVISESSRAVAAN